MNLQPIHDLLRMRIGLEPEALGATTVRDAVAARVAACRAADLGAYLTLLLPLESPEFDELVERVVVSESWFFRGAGVFSALAEYARAVVRDRQGRGPFRALSVPCASGEEPYSLAMALEEGGVGGSTCTIEGVDLSRRCLERAQAGLFGELAFREMASDVRGRFFRPFAGQWQIDPRLRQGVQFRRANLVAVDFLAGEVPFDLVLCRNVLIYLDDAARERCLDNLERLLAPGGVVGVGHAEPQLLETRGYRPFGNEGHFLFCKKATPPNHPGGPGHGPVPSRPLPATKPMQRPAARGAPAVPPVTAAVDPLAAARACADAGVIGEALELCRRALAAGPSADGYSLLGVLQQAGQQFDEAVQSFRKALYLQPAHPEALLHLMILYNQRGQSAQADRLRRKLERHGGEST